jgi:hypothetical protein
MKRASPLLSACLAAGLVGGCATGGDFPSLAPRAVEQLSFEEPVRVDPPVAADPALSGRANALLAQARTGDRQFEDAYAGALPAIRAAGPVGSDSWVQAQEAISRVEAARIGTSSALSELDLLIAEQSDDPTNNAVWANLQAARQAAEDLVADQRRRLDQLKSSVSSP